MIELLVVIAILAVLAVAVVLVLNPAELIKEGRDTTRISDLATLNSAIALWTADVLSTSGTGGWPSSETRKCQGGTTAPGGTACVAATSTAVSGGGWVPLDFTKIASGSPLSREPIDPNLSGTCKNVPTSSTVCQYAFYASTTVGVYKLEALMESAKFYTGGSSDVITKTGGIYTGIYETGSYLSVAL